MAVKRDRGEKIMEKLIETSNTMFLDILYKSKDTRFIKDSKGYIVGIMGNSSVKYKKEYINVKQTKSIV